MCARRGRRRKSRAAAVALAALLTSCALLRPASQTAPPGWEARAARLGGIEQFTLKGRAASGFFGAKADLHWRQRGESFELRLSGPFNARAVLIESSGLVVTVRTADATFSTTEPELELQRRLGWTLPISDLRWWVLGLPAPETPAELRWDETGRLAGLEQSGWTLEYLDYQPATTLELPRRLELGNGEATIKLVVDQWLDLPDP